MIHSVVEILICALTRIKPQPCCTRTTLQPAVLPGQARLLDPKRLSESPTVTWSRDKEEELRTSTIYLTADKTKIPAQSMLPQAPSKGRLETRMVLQVSGWVMLGERGLEVAAAFTGDKGRRTGCLNGRAGQLPRVPEQGRAWELEQCRAQSPGENAKRATRHQDLLWWQKECDNERAYLSVPSFILKSYLTVHWVSLDFPRLPP